MKIENLIADLIVMRHIVLFILSALLFICSCTSRHQNTGFDQEELYATVMWIDSINNAIIEQSPSSYPEIINPETGEPYPKEVVIATWKENEEYWKQFVRYIRRHQFQKASDLLMETDSREIIQCHLREPELIAQFILNVVDGLLEEYHGDKYYSTLTSWQYSEVSRQMNINGIAYGDPHDVAPSFPGLVLSYGITLSSSGRLDLALELVPIYNLANTYINPEDDLWQQYAKVHFESTLYHLDGQGAKGDSILLDFRDNVTPEYGARGKDAAKDVDEAIAYWAGKE